MIDPKKWKEEGGWRKAFEKDGIIVLDKFFFDKKLLYCCSCSKEKSESGTPKDMYIGPWNVRFYNWCEANGFYYAVLSDKYGVFFCDEKKKLYDVHPSQVSRRGFIVLSSIIKRKVLKKGYRGFIYYHPSPLGSRPYIRMMEGTGLKIYYTTKLHPQGELL